LPKKWLTLVYPHDSAQISQAGIGAHPVSDIIGQTIGNYRIDARLGAGGMGQVYRARHIHLDRLAAIKLLHESMATDSGFQARFRQEARAIAALQHPNIVEVYDFGEQAGRCYLALELLDDGSLRALVRQHAQAGQPWSLMMALDLMRQAADGLAYAHKQGMVHRDIKPDNLLLKRAPDAATPERYILKITDFGLARLAEGSVVTATGQTMGTPQYMSPEQCQGLALDGRSDIYSLGIVLYELATGYPPFAVKTLSEAAFKHVYEAPTPPRQVRPDVPAALEAIILRCLAKPPAERFATADELSRALQQVLLGQEPLLSRTMIQAVPAPTPAPLPSSPPAGTVVQSQPSKIAPPTVVSLVGSSALPRIQLLNPQGQVLRALDVSGAGLTIGRLSTNTLMLDDEAISRHHVRIDWDGARVTVTDVGSSNGSLLGDRRLQPQVAETWAWREMLHLGPFWLRLEPPKLATPPADDTFLQGLLSGAATAVRTNISATLASRMGSGSGRIAVILEKEQYELTPGQPTVVNVTLANLGSIVDHLTVTVEGVPSAWVRSPDQALQLTPGMQASVALNVTITRSAENLAGTYPVVVRARSRDNLADSGSANARWIVLPFSESNLSITPKRASGWRQAEYTLTIRNAGSTPANYAFAAEDDESALQYRYEPAQTNVAPGASASVRLTVLGERRWFGSPLLRTLNVRAMAKDEQIPPITAQFVHQARLPGWIVALLVPLLLLCVGGGALANNRLIVQPSNATASAVANSLFAQQTATALAQGTQIAAAQTAPAEAKTAILATVTAAAQQAETAQAISAQTATVIGLATSAAQQAADAAAQQTQQAQAAAAQKAADAAAQQTQQAQAAAAQQATAAAQQTQAAVAQQTQTAQAVATLTATAIAGSGIDIYAAAPKANWSSGAGALPFNGSDGDSHGFAIARAGTLVLEDGSAPTMLETHPQWVDNGYIRGEFNVALIASGQHFLTSIGFIKPVGNPGTNGVTVKITFAGKTIYEGIKTYTGKLTVIDIDMSGYSGQSGKLVLEVGANGNAAQDWLCWVKPRIGFPARLLPNLPIIVLPLKTPTPTP
jgi:serine/threonine protein kinase